MKNVPSSNHPSVSSPPSNSGLLPQRCFRPGVNLSVFGLGGMVVVGMDPRQVERLIAESVERGVNYYDVAPVYGKGEAEEKIGAALRPIRNRVFLACKTLERTAAGARRELEQSLRLLHSDHLDLYQLHSVNRSEEVEQILSPGGAAEALVRAREEGLIRYLGFSSHSVPAALNLLDRFQFDSVLFPVNFVCFARGNFGPQVLEKAEARGVACLALKALALSPWRKDEPRRCPNCWYHPIEDAELALQALRFTLSERVVAALLPGDERLCRMAMEFAAQIRPLTAEERAQLSVRARSLRPIMTAARRHH